MVDQGVVLSDGESGTIRLRVEENEMRKEDILFWKFYLNMERNNRKSTMYSGNLVKLEEEGI